MIFRGLISDVAAMRDFMNIANSISKLSKESIMRISEKKVYFIMSGDDAGPRKPYVWCELPVAYYFKDYTLVGTSPEHNEIYLSFDTGMLAKSVMTAKNNAKLLKIKLTNKQIPCITLVIEQVSGENAQTRQCIHDIPIEIIARKNWGDYTEPTFDDFHVSLLMPNLKSMKSIVERMKNVSPNLIVSATKSGTLTLKSKTNMVTIAAHCPDLSVQSFAVVQDLDAMDATNENDVDNSEVVSAVVDVKKFLMFLTGMHFNKYRTVCSIVQGRMVKLYLEQPDVLSFQFFLMELSC